MYTHCGPGQDFILYFFAIRFVIHKKYHVI